jgi:hypothetical protein
MQTKKKIFRISLVSVEMASISNLIAAFGPKLCTDFSQPSYHPQIVQDTSFTWLFPQKHHEERSMALLV